MNPRSFALLVFWLVGVAPYGARAQAVDSDVQQALALSRKGDCEKAIPVFEEAELARHRPAVAVALAGCYLAAGELGRARDLLTTVASETQDKSWSDADRLATQQAKRKLAEIDARMPKLIFETLEDYEGLEVTVNGSLVESPGEPLPVLPHRDLTIVVRAPGYKDYREQVRLSERERHVILLDLVPLPLEEKRKQEARLPTKPPRWLGFRARNLVIPKAMMNLFGDGGTDLFVPGADVTYSIPAFGADLVFGGGWRGYFLGETSYKPSGTPDTEYEILESNLQALLVTVDFMKSFALNASRSFNFRLGAGVGVGWMFAGELNRTQAFPPSGVAGDPYSYAKCRGPNDPAGSFRYCNQLDKDFDHYGGYSEPSWFNGGVTPTVFPWIALPELGLSIKTSDTFVIDIETGLSISGIIGSVGGRFSL